MCFIFYTILFSRQWLLDKQDLQVERSPAATFLDEDEYKKVMIFYINC